MDYNYTKPRGPVGAMYSSPGPAVYQLPGLLGQNTHDPRSTQNKAPAYCFGVRHGKLKDDCSPGPQYHPDAKYYRDGKDGTPQYSLFSRPKTGTQFHTPGPGAYSPESSGPVSKYEAPKYSFGTRGKHRRTDNVPAPNSYSLPEMTGNTIQSKKRQAPQYSMTGRSKIGGFHEDLQKTPGPGSYKTMSPDTWKNKSPHYSMTSRNNMPGDTTKKPGPGAHSPEKLWPNKKQAPQFSFGIGHSQYEAPLIVDVRD